MVLIACPELGVASHKNFEETTKRLVEMYGQYHKCRTAAIAGQEPLDE